MLANVVVAMRLRGLWQWQLASHCDLPPWQLKALIAERRPLDPWQRERLSEILNADPAWLFESVQEIPTAPGIDGTKPSSRC